MVKIAPFSLILYTFVILMHKGIKKYSKIRLEVPKAKCVTFGDRAFSVAGPKLWNSLPAHIKQAENFIAFRKALKTYLFKKAFNC